MDSRVPAQRVVTCNDAPVRDGNSGGEYVLYWMIAQRRVDWNFSLDRAIDWARELAKPLVVFEGLRCDYPWASQRHHAFVIQGMATNARRLASSPVAYYPWVEREPGEGRGLLEALAERAAVVVTDDFPCFFLPRMVAAAAERLPVRLEKVDANGLLPMRATDRVFARAVDFRRYLQKTLGEHLGDVPRRRPPTGSWLAALEAPPSAVTRRWPAADLEALGDDLSALPIDTSVPPVEVAGGTEAAREILRRFLDGRLDRYVEDRLDVVDRASSELSFHLHFGHLSVHEVFHAVTDREGWDPGQVFHKATASRSGWWGLSEPAEAFLDELLTWRELGFNLCALREGYDRYDSLPEWARKTLEEHAGDPRPHVYPLASFESASTHDPLWNAAQRELVRDGRIHNYLRMLWGKKILEWSATPQDALEVMIELNNKYALDGRDANSYSGIFWCLGRYDRAWGPERPIFGKVRYMSSDSTRRKLDAKAYLAEYGEGSG